MVKEPRWEKIGEWIQEEGCIRNRVPEGVSAKDLIGKRAKDTFANMVLKDRVFGDCEVRCTMSFDDRMAPSILGRCAVEKNKDGVFENRHMYSVVLFDEGINVWRYSHEAFTATKRGWRKVAFSRFKLLPKTKYELKVTVNVRRKCIEVTVGDHHIGVTDEAMPAGGHVGICGCEGVNRFYDFSVRGIGRKKK